MYWVHFTEVQINNFSPESRTVYLDSGSISPLPLRTTISNSYTVLAFAAAKFIRFYNADIENYWMVAAKTRLHFVPQFNEWLLVVRLLMMLPRTALIIFRKMSKLTFSSQMGWKALKSKLLISFTFRLWSHSMYFYVLSNLTDSIMWILTNLRNVLPKFLAFFHFSSEFMLIRYHLQWWTPMWPKNGVTDRNIFEECILFRCVFSCNLVTSLWSPIFLLVSVMSFFMG